MADPTIDATVGGASANSYITRANAQVHFNGRLSADEWTNASNADKDRALIMATYRMEQEQYEGSPVTTSQNLKWPRYSAYNDSGDTYASDEIPDVVERAVCELALAILKDPTIMSDSGMEGFTKVGVGPLAVEPRASRRAGTLPQHVIRMLRTVRVATGGITARVWRG